MASKEVEAILQKYSRKIESEANDYNRNVNPSEDISKDYSQFKQDMMPELSKYESWARGLGNFIKIKLSPKDEEKLSKSLEVAHLDITPSEVVGLSMVSFIGVFFMSILFSLAVWLLFEVSFSKIFPFLFLMMFAAGFLFYYFYSMPDSLGTKWRLKASSQMVPAILYTVVYMKHTSNLERAIQFVAQHIEEPLALDLKKVLWDVETGKFSSIKESLDYYLDSWKTDSIEFVESFHLIESSLYEPSESRRIQVLERALSTILDGVYEKMLKYTHNIKTPLTNVYMLGIVLPTLTLALLPLASTLLSGYITTIHVLILFNIIVPFLVFYMTSNIMLERPGGYGETTLLEKNPYYSQFISKEVYLTSGAICFPFFLIGILPLLFGYTPLPEWLGLTRDFALSGVMSTIFGENFFGFIYDSTGAVVGPFGVGSLVLSLFIPLSLFLFFSISYSMKTKKLIHTRDDSKLLENEFNNSLFTLGNRLGDGTPAEIAFMRVAQSSKGQRTEDFFRIVASNIQTMGMSLQEALFNPSRGALVYYPSSLIATSMRILVESVKKGLTVAAQSLMSISDYVKNIHKINERLRDLLAEIISDMKSNMTFLAPLLAGIVVGLTSMITGILGKIGNMVKAGQGDVSIGGISSISSLNSMFSLEKMIAPYFLQIIIGIYIVQIIFILTKTLVSIDSGEDKLKQTSEIAKNLLQGGLLYFIVALIGVFALSLLASVALGGLGA